MTQQVSQIQGLAIKGQPLLVIGPVGSGKLFLVSRAIGSYHSFIEAPGFDDFEEAIKYRNPLVIDLTLGTKETDPQRLLKLVEHAKESDRVIVGVCDAVEVISTELLGAFTDRINWTSL